MSEIRYPHEFNKIKRSRTFEVSSFVTAYIFDRNPDAEPYWEEYEFSQIFMVLEGRGTYTTETASYPMEAGMMFLRPAFRRSSYSWETDQVRFALISFECTSPAMDGLGERPIRLYEEETATLMDVIRTAVRICEPVKDNEQRSGMQVKAHVPEVVLSFIYASLERFLAMVCCRLSKIDLLLDESQKVSRYVDGALLTRQAKKFMMDHLNQPLTIRDVCAHLGVSPSALSSKFRREMNESVISYFIDLKIGEAQKLLKTSSMTFTEIAESLGFSSVNYFSRVFKARTGVTPTAYSRHASKRLASADIRSEE